MASLKQADRLMQFSSPVGKDQLLIESIEGAEGISRLFEYHVDLLATVDTSIEPKDLIGAKVSVGISLNDAEGTRWISGIVASFEQCAGDEEFNVFRARIVPSMWQLTLSANCKIFQSKTALDIVKEVIGVYGLSISDQTSGSYQALEYCTQYSETDFHFVSRIMEESGIFYWFEHSDQDNKIVLGDSRNAYQDCPLSATVPYALTKRGVEGAYGSVVNEFTSTATMVSGKHSTADYNYRNFARIDSPEKSSASPYGGNAFEQYLFPAGSEGFANDTVATSTNMEQLFIETRATASDAMAEVLRGSSSARSLCAGYTFTLEDHPSTAWNRKYLLTAVTLTADQVPPYRAADAGQDQEFSNQFTAISSDNVFKAQPAYRKPRIYGPQTARVVGPSGEEIYLDALGRAKVQFFWDKIDAEGDATSSTWVRVAQGWAGNGWGAHFWPRVNDEVVVQFLNGDPDNPVITGSVYNGKNSPPYPLPDNGTRSGILSRSSKGGSAANANQLRFEDKRGSEQIYIHAEKDMDLSIENDRRTLVAKNDSLTVTGNQTEQVGGDFNREVKSNLVEKVGSNLDLAIGSNLTESVGSNHSLKVGSNQAISVGSAYSLNANNTVYIKGGQTVVIEAGLELSLVASGNFITLGPAGVAISGVMVLINSGGAAGQGQAGQVQSPKSPKAPDAAENDDGSGGGSSSSSSSSSPASSSTPSASAPPTPSLPAGIPSAANITAMASQATQAAQGAVNQAQQAVQGAANQAQQAIQQGLQQAQQLAQQAVQQAQAAAQAAQQAAQQAVAAAQAAADQVMQQARAAYQQAQQAVQQAQAAAAAAVGQAKAAAQQALNQAEQQAQQCAQAGAQAAQQAQQEANQIKQQAEQAAQQAEQQAQQAVAQAQQAAQQAAAQAQAAAQQAEQQAQQAVQQGEQAAQQAAAQAQQAAQQAEQQAQQAAQQAQQAAKQAEQQAQQAEQQASQAANQVKQAASQAAQQAQQASQAAQQSASQAISQATKGL
jgi:type VI secretion system secreted protein VgrG